MESGWIKGAPVSLVLNEDKVWYSVSASDSVTNSDLSPLCPNFRVERKGEKVKISADKIQLSEYTDMTAGGVWAWGKTRPIKPEGENTKRWSKAEITTTSKPFDGMYLGDIVASDAVNETLLWLPENVGGKTVLTPFIVLSTDYLGGVYVTRKYLSESMKAAWGGSFYYPDNPVDKFLSSTYLNSILDKDVTSQLLTCSVPVQSKGNNAVAEHISRKCWVLSYGELYGTTTNDGTKMPYFEAGASHRVAYVDGGANKGIYWTRSREKGGTPYSVDVNGAMSLSNGGTAQYYIRPSFVLPKDFKVQQRPDGSYTVWDNMGLMKLGDIDASTSNKKVSVNIVEVLKSGNQNLIASFVYAVADYNSSGNALMVRDNNLFMTGSMAGAMWSQTEAYQKLVQYSAMDNASVITTDRSLHSSIRSIIKEVSVKSVDTSGALHDDKAKCFLLSTTEYGFGDKNTGTPIPYYSVQGNRIHKDSSGVVAEGWTRDAAKVEVYNYYYIGQDGQYSSKLSGNSLWLRPCFAIPPSVPIRKLADGTYDLVPDDPYLATYGVEGKASGDLIQLKDIPVAATGSPRYAMLNENNQQQKYVIVQNNVGATTPNVILYREGMLPDIIQFNRVASESYHPYENSELDSYCSNYISKLDENIRKHLVEAPIVLYDSQSKQTKTINRKAFTPSIANIFGVNASVGNTQFEWAKTWSNLNLPLGNTFWSSTTSVGMGTRKIEAIGATGAFYSRGQTETAAVIFLIAMNPDTWFEDNGDGSYTFVGDPPTADLELEITWPETDTLVARQWTYNEAGAYQTMLLGGVASTDAPPPLSYSKILADNSWEQIAQAAADGVAQDLWEIGDTKDIVVNGETLTVAIMDFNHDDLADGSGKAPITFGMTQLMATQRQMNSKNTSAGSFTGSAIYSWLSGSVYSGLNSELKKVIKAVNKKTSAGEGSSSIRTDAMHLWFFSEVEVFGTTTYSVAGEGLHYPYFATASERIKKLSNGTGAVSYWWERSPRHGNSTTFCIVDTSGSAYIDGAGISSGVCFGFCI